MNELSLFLKSNKTSRENIFFPASAALCGADGVPLLWELRPVTTGEDEILRDECTRFDRGVPRFDHGAYALRLACAAVVTPNLRSAEIQDSYGVTGERDLLKQLLDSPGEYQELVKKVHGLCGFKSEEELTAEAKN